MNVDTRALDAIKAGAKPPRTKRADWMSLDLDRLNPGVYLAADPSVSSFGLVLFEVSQKDPFHGARFSVHAAESFHSKEGQFGTTGWEDMLNRAGMIEGFLGEWIARWAVQFPDAVAVHEMPPMGGGRLASPESALLASYAFRSAIGRMPLLKMVPRQSHARMICGNGNAKKAIYHKVLRDEVLPCVEGEELITNEAKRDALCVALYAALTRS